MKDVFEEFKFGCDVIDKQSILEYEFRENRSIEFLQSFIYMLKWM